jgi:hypothetical protein
MAQDGRVRSVTRAIVALACITGVLSIDATSGAQILTSTAASRAPAFRATVSPLPAPIRRLMRGSSWHPGCPVPLDDLRLIRLTYWGFDRSAHSGKLVVHTRWAHKIARVFGKLYDARFPIHRMQLVDRFGADDMRSMKADNTSAFNCRYRDGVCCVWSQHAYGRAIDINPVENPYVGDWGVSPPNGSTYVKRTPLRKGMLSFRDRAWWAFHHIGWEWGGRWPWPIDYQHFSSNNR